MNVRQTGSIQASAIPCIRRIRTIPSSHVVAIEWIYAAYSIIIRAGEVANGERKTHRLRNLGSGRNYRLTAQVSHSPNDTRRVVELRFGRLWLAASGLK
jgi:hypothetical protein